MTRRKVLVIGLDGASWTILDPLLEKLPNIRRLISQGTYGNLASSIPPRTFPAWKCYSTGLNPGKLGVFDFFKIDFSTRQATVCDSRDFHGPEIWDIMGKHRKIVCIINMPTTYPPKKVNGVMISGPFSAESGFTFPKTLEKRLKERHDYQPFMDQLSFETEREASFKMALRLIKTRFDVAKNMLKGLDPDFLHLTVFLCDMIQHFGTENEIKQAWKLIDSEIGKIASLLDDEWTIILMSDHGFADKVCRFNVNSWLRENGYLVAKPPSSIRGIRIEAFYEVARKTGILNLVKKIISRSTLRKIGGKIAHTHGKMGPQGVIDSLDWNNSAAFFTGSCIFLINKNDRTKASLVQEIESLVDPATKKRVILKAYVKEEAYSGSFIDDAPDIIPVALNGYELGTGIWEPLFDYGEKGWKRDHSETGMYVINGRHFKSQFVANASILDLAPTILKAMGLPIPSEFDGRVIAEAFR